MNSKTATILNAMLGCVPPNGELVISEDNKLQAVSVGTKSIPYTGDHLKTGREKRQEMQANYRAQLGINEKGEMITNG